MNRRSTNNHRSHLLSACLLSGALLIAAFLLASLQLFSAPAASAQTSKTGGQPQSSDAPGAGDKGATAPAGGLPCSSNIIQVTSDNPSDNDQEILGISARTPTDVWAVGYYGMGQNEAIYPLIEHWDGATWRVVPNPTLNNVEDSWLTAVQAVSATDVWAVGSYDNGSTGNSQTLIEHWNGTTWTIVSSDNLSSYDNILYGVAVVSPTDVWAVGNYRSSSTAAYRTLLEHWNGSYWLATAGPNQGASTVPNMLSGVTAVPGTSSPELWAVGYYTVGNIASPLALHYKNKSWTLSNPGKPGTHNNQFNAVTAVSQNEVWAVGQFDNIVSGQTYNLVELWNGTSWSNVNTQYPSGYTGGYLNSVTQAGPGHVYAAGSAVKTGNSLTVVEQLSAGGGVLMATPNGDPSGGNLYSAISASSATDIWAGGYYSPAGSVQAIVMAAHYDGNGWSWTQMPGAPTNDTYVAGVAASSSTNAWVVGSFEASGNFAKSQTFTEHWNGSYWRWVYSPNAANNGAPSALMSVATVPGNDNDAWAVGYYNDPNSHVERTLIERWNGTNWNVIPSPNFGNYENELHSVVAANANEAWAVGYYINSSNNKQTLILHWSNSNWTVVNSPNLGNNVFNELNAVTLVPGTNGAEGWAVGGYYQAGQTIYPLVEHLTNGVWQVVTGFNGAYQNEMFSVSAYSSGDVWMAGTGHKQQDQLIFPVTYHLSGNSWTQIEAPANNSTYGTFTTIVATGGNDAWAAGSYNSGPNTSSTLVEHWDGSKWNVVSSPSPGAAVNTLAGLAAVSPTDIWAAGFYRSTGPGIGQTLVEHYGPCAQPTATATATPATCSVQFTDVAQGSAFYSYVRCLACRNVLGGYSDNAHCAGSGVPCFRPNDNVTRGQAAKIIANAAAYNDAIPANQQSFADVPSSNPFWVYIERVRLHGAISGSPCTGTNGEPSSGTCYRPGNNLTRGQLAKIASNAANFNDTPSGQSFADVPSSNPFYTYIERAHIHNIISGYQCGGAGEPCPGAYFRPGVNVTRGQAAKIISGTFFPNCQTP